MAQTSSYTVSDGSGSAVRTAINTIIAALASNSSGPTAPESPIVGQTWVDTTASPNTLNMWDGAEWDTIAILSSSGIWGLIEPLADARYLKLSGGTLIGALIGTSATVTSLTVNGVSVNNASVITEGTFNPAQLGTGTPSATTVLLGNGAWGQISFSTLSGDIAPGQVPENAVTQWESALSISASQITGTINAAELQGYQVATTPTPSTVVLRDGAGYIWGTYLNQSSGQNENPSISQVAVNNGSDGFWRKAGLAYFLEQAILSSAVIIQPLADGVPALSPGQIALLY